MRDREKVLERIKKLLALSNSDNEHEAANAASQAQLLLSKYNLCIDDISDVVKSDYEVKEARVAEGKRLDKWFYKLFISVSRSFGCSPLVETSYRHKALIMVGTETDILSARLTLEYLYTTIERLTNRNALGNGRAFVNSYRQGLVTSIASRLSERTKENTKEAQKEATFVGTALVLRKDQALKDYMDKFAKTFKSGSSTLSDYSGYAQGLHDGESIGLDKQLKGNCSNLVIGC